MIWMIALLGGMFKMIILITRMVIRMDSIVLSVHNRGNAQPKEADVLPKDVKGITPLSIM